MMDRDVLDKVFDQLTELLPKIVNKTLADLSSPDAPFPPRINNNGFFSYNILGSSGFNQVVNFTGLPEIDEILASLTEEERQALFEVDYLRLNIMPLHMQDMKNGGSDHFHRHGWELVSRVVAGELIEVHSIELPTELHEAETMPIGPIGRIYSTLDVNKTEKTGEGPRTIAPTGKTLFMSHPFRITHSDETYTMPDNEFHDSLPSPSGAVTLCATSRARNVASLLIAPIRPRDPDVVEVEIVPITESLHAEAFDVMKDLIRQPSAPGISAAH